MYRWCLAWMKQVEFIYNDIYSVCHSFDGECSISNKFFNIDIGVVFFVCFFVFSGGEEE